MTTSVETTTPLSIALQRSTSEAHERAENSGFVTRLLAGEADVDALVALLAQSLPVYEALEDSITACADDPRLAPLVDPRLVRAAALRHDLEVHRANGHVIPEVLPAARAYADELRAAASDPAALIGHHYVRYLGDLSGGQIIARLVQRHYGLDEGLSFYSFDIDKPKVYKDHYRAALDSLPLDERDQRAAMDAATSAFEHNSAIFAQLEDSRTTGS